jgi:cytidyltransferase-like protein
MKKIVIVSGYFNPLHKGHIEYFKNAKSFGDELHVIVNNDLQRSLKNSKIFMDQDERLTIIKELRLVDRAYLSIDLDRTVKESIRNIWNIYNINSKIYFANGGDQTNESIPEKDLCDELNIQLIDGLGNKIQSSSWLLK